MTLSSMPHIPVLHTARLTLREPLDSDVAPLAAFLTSGRAKWIGGPFPDDDAAEWLDWQREKWTRHGRGQWIVALKDGETPVGRVGLMDRDDWHEPELVWFLFDGFEGKGYAHEAALAARTFAGKSLNLPPLFSFIEPGNRRSHALVDRLGAKHEGDARFEGSDFHVYRHPGDDA